MLNFRPYEHSKEVHNGNMSEMKTEVEMKI